MPWSQNQGDEARLGLCQTRKDRDGSGCVSMAFCVPAMLGRDDGCHTFPEENH